MLALDLLCIVTVTVASEVRGAVGSGCGGVEVAVEERKKGWSMEPCKTGGGGTLPQV